MRKARAQSAVHMLVDEKRPEKTRRAQSSQDVPGRGERQENCRTRKQAKLAPAMPSPSHRDERDYGARGEKQPYQRACQDSNGAQAGGPPIPHAGIKTSGPRAEKQVENPFKRQRVDRFRNHVPRKEEHSHAGGNGQSAVEPGPLAKKPPAEFERKQDDSHHGQAHREPGRKFAFAQRSEEHTSELQSRSDLVCRLLLE